MLEVRKGSWSTGMYLEDLCAPLFVDVSVPQGEAVQLSYGCELYQEVKISAGPLMLTINRGVGMGFTLEGKFFTQLVVKGDLGGLL